MKCFDYTPLWKVPMIVEPITANRESEYFPHCVALDSKNFIFVNSKRVGNGSGKFGFFPVQPKLFRSSQKSLNQFCGTWKYVNGKVIAAGFFSYVSWFSPSVSKKALKMLDLRVIFGDPAVFRVVQSWTTKTWESWPVTFMSKNQRVSSNGFQRYRTFSFIICSRLNTFRTRKIFQNLLLLIIIN